MIYIRSRAFDGGRGRADQSMLTLRVRGDANAQGPQVAMARATIGYTFFITGVYYSIDGSPRDRRLLDISKMILQETPVNHAKF